MVAALRGDMSGPAAILRTLQERRDAAVAGLNAIDGLTVHAPESTFYLFVNVTQVMQRKGLMQVNQLMDQALTQADVSFCTRNHFGRPLPGEAQHYIRLAYSGIDAGDIEVGLWRLKTYFEA
jgi:aspartate/methionine/tyrosine aminotransferase